MTWSLLPVSSCQGCGLHILRDGCRQASVPRLHRGGRAASHLPAARSVLPPADGGPLTPLVWASNRITPGMSPLWQREKPLQLPWTRLTNKVDWMSLHRHSHRGQLAWNMLHGRVQVLQVPQVQNSAAHKPRAEVRPGPLLSPERLLLLLPRGVCLFIFHRGVLTSPGVIPDV